MKKLIIFIPLVAVILISIFSFIYLKQDNNPNKPPSALINKDIPKFEIISLFDKKIKLSNENINDQIVIINFFASWCLPCKEEHPLFYDLKKKYPELIIIGINHKDKVSEAKKFLKNNGNPYTFVGQDIDGNIAMEFGVFGLPETFLTNNEGKIIFKYLGPITKKVIKNEIIPHLL